MKSVCRLKFVWFMLGLVIVASCSDQAQEEPVDVHPEYQEVIRQLQDLQERLSEALAAIDAQKIQLATQKQIIAQYHRLNDTVTALTELQDFRYEIIREDEERIFVYLQNVPDDSSMEIIYLIRAALEFSYTNKKVDLWTDKTDLLKYLSGDYESEGKVLGWNGLDSRVGIVDQQAGELKYYFSRDNAMQLEFGKYHMPK